MNLYLLKQGLLKNISVDKPTDLNAFLREWECMLLKKKSSS